MNELDFLAQYPSLIGENSFWMFFSAKKISEKFEITTYAARKMVKSLHSRGLIYRVANQYTMGVAGGNIAYTLAELKAKKGGVESENS